MFRSYSWTGVPSASSTTLLHTTTASNLGSKKINDIEVLNTKEIVLVGDNGAYYHSSASDVNTAGQITSISWYAQTGVYSSSIDPYYVNAANQINIKTIAFTNSKTGVLGGAYTGSFNSSLYNQEAYVRSFYDVLSRYTARFYYDGLGRLVVSQNARQYNNTDATGRKYSYTLYDALGRVYEVGEKTEPSSGAKFKSIFGATVADYYNPNVISTAKLETWIANTAGARKEVTKSYYDATVITGLPATFTPDVLTQRKRITHVTYEETFDGNDQTYDHATHYDYDIHGNVQTLLQDNKKMATTFTSIASQRYKRMDYRYDLVSGNVHRMSVQNGEVDQWHHAYQYDADNRITAAYTNTQTPIIGHGQLSAALENEMVYNSDWENDAKYYYYAHGPLARTEIGNDQLQGFDYIYNLQGWLKGTNSIVNENDAGQDGYSGVNSTFAKDVSAFSLEYFNNDYQAINSETPFASVETSSHAASNSSALYNGNIRYMQTRLTNPTTGEAMPMLNTYKYDQINRLLESRSYETGLSSNSWNPVSYGNSYYNSFSYDAMGNILTQVRHNRAGTKIEDMKYKYQYLDPTTKTKLQRNRLYHIYEPLSLSSLDATDIDNMGSFDSTAVNINVTNNYSYDEEGRLIKINSELIPKITWSHDGRIKEFLRVVGSETKIIRFDYDSQGNRIAKHIINNQTNSLIFSLYYLRDATGNVNSIYRHENGTENTSYSIIERNIFGNARLGFLTDSVNLINHDNSSNYTLILGKKKYEFSNHLDNILSVFSDIKVPIDSNFDGLVDGYEINIINSTDYSPFGVALDGRSLGKKTRYGLNGKEKDFEISDDENFMNFEFREYDARIGQFFSVDPLFNHENQVDKSTYSAFWDNPVMYDDPDGRCPICPWLDAVVDIGFVIYDIGLLAHEGITTGSTSAENWAALGADAFSIIIPMSTGAGLATRGTIKAAKAADNATDVVKATDKLSDVGKIKNLKSVDVITKGYKSFKKSNFRDNLKLKTGHNGKGMEAHHKIPQSKSMRKWFNDHEITDTDIHKPSNGVWREKTNHRKLSKQHNREWKKWQDDNPNAKRDDILRQRDIIEEKVFGNSTGDKLKKNK